MAGLYVHIPFCKKRCLYCDFFSTTQLERRAEYIDAVLKEIAARRDEAGEPIKTIYIGGGTPSTLSIQAIQRILEAIEALSLDCTAKKGVWHSDSEIKIDKLGYVIRNGVKTKDFWDGAITSEQKPLRLKIRNICGDETVWEV